MAEKARRRLPLVALIRRAVGRPYLLMAAVVLVVGAIWFTRLALQEFLLIDRLINRYLDQLATHRQVWTNREAFRRLFDFTSIQRNLKAAGRFVYIDRVKGNPKFLADIPRVLNYVKRNLQKYPELDTLRKHLTPYVPELQ